MNLQERIVVDSAVLAGKPIVRGTRLAVDFIVELLGHGWTEQQILDNYQGLQVEDIRACLIYAAEVVKTERVFPLAS
jgi:uncharacterized protein (DUF433 family)